MFLSNESPKILVVIPHLKIGGAQRQALLLTKELLAKGIGVRIALVGLEGDRRKRDYETLWREFELDEHVIVTAGSAHLDRLVLGLTRYAKLRISVLRRGVFRLRELTEKLRSLGSQTLDRLLGLSIWIEQAIPIFARVQRIWQASKLGAAGLVLPPQLRNAIFAILREHPDLLGHLERIPSLLLRAHYIQSIVSKEAPDMIISFLTQTNLACLIAGYRGAIPILVSERNDVLLQPVPPHVAALRKSLYTGARLITANSPSSMDGLTQWFPRQEIRLLANDFPRTIARRSLSTRKFGVVCRLEKQKNVDLIVRGFVKSGLSTSGWQLEIWGEGPEFEYLAQTINLLHASQTVHLRGVTRTPLEVMVEIDFLVAASSYEGSSNSIHEAVSVGAVPLYSKSIAEMTQILPSDLGETFGFQLDPDEISQTIRRVTSEEFRDSGAVDLMRDRFEQYWKGSRETRRVLLEEIDEILVLANKPGALQHLPTGRKTKLGK